VENEKPTGFAAVGVQIRRGV